MNLPAKIDGYWSEGYCIEEEILKCSYDAKSSLKLRRSELSENLYLFKVKFDYSHLNYLANKVSIFIKHQYKNIDVILPVPPSNINRPYQPVVEIAKRVSEQIDIPCDVDYLQSINKTPIKFIRDAMARENILMNKFSIGDSRYENMSILVLDDHYSSGGTLNTVGKLLFEKGKVKEVYVLTLIGSLK